MEIESSQQLHGIHPRQTPCNHRTTTIASISATMRQLDGARRVGERKGLEGLGKGTVFDVFKLRTGHPREHTGRSYHVGVQTSWSAAIHGKHRRVRVRQEVDSVIPHSYDPVLKTAKSQKIANRQTQIFLTVRLFHDTTE